MKWNDILFSPDYDVFTFIIYTMRRTNENVRKSEKMVMVSGIKSKELKLHPRTRDSSF